MDENKQRRYEMWREEVDQLAFSFGVSTKTLLTILQGKWKHKVYGWHESNDFIDQVLYGEC
jgi:hypothetical protein